MKPYNPSRVNTAKTNMQPKKKVAKRKKTQPENKPSTKRLVPVGNQAPWTFGGPPLGGKANSQANLPRKTKKRIVKNRAPKKRVPNMGNTGSMGMMGY